VRRAGICAPAARETERERGGEEYAAIQAAREAAEAALNGDDQF